MLRANNELNLAIEILSSAKDQNAKLSPSTVKSSYFNRKAAILFELKDHRGTIEALTESQMIDSAMGYTWRLNSNQILKGAAFRELGEKQNAKNEFNDVIKRAKNDPEEEDEYLLALYNITFLYFGLEQFNDAIIQSSKYIKRAKENPLTNSQLDEMYHAKAISFKALGKLDSAFNYLDEAHKMRLDEMQGLIEEKSDAIKDVVNLYEARESKNRLEEENRAKKQQSVILVLAIALLVFVIFVVNRRRNYYKSLNNKQEELNLQLHHNSEFKTKLMGILAHDIRNPMNGIIGMLNLYGEK